MSQGNAVDMDTVYVLGAGCSRAAGAPLMFEFQAAAKEILDATDSPSPEDVFGSATGAEEGFRNAYREWIQVAPEMDVEAYYVLRELLARLKPSARQFDALSDLQYLIGKTIDLQLRKATIQESSIRRHDDFVSALKERMVKRDQVDHPRRVVQTIVTLNWDILFENEVFKDSDLKLDYGREKVGAVDESGGWEPYSDAGALHVRALKLHGSLNWWYCRDCDFLWYRRFRKAAVEHMEFGEEKCPKIETHEVELVFTPPTSQKFERPATAPATWTSPLSEIWGKARDSFATCKTLVFAGYSFPATDVQFRVLLQEALRRNKGLQQIMVVTNRKHGVSRSAFEDHYLKMLGPLRSGTSVEFSQDGFEGWVAADCPTSSLRDSPDVELRRDARRLRGAHQPLNL